LALKLYSIFITVGGTGVVVSSGGGRQKWTDNELTPPPTSLSFSLIYSIVAKKILCLDNLF
jgi:hypothetical protein